MKLFKKVAILSASLAMVVASGLVIGKAGLESTSAAEEVVASCDFTKKATSSTNYKTAWVYDKAWNILGGANNNGVWDYMKFGPKNSTVTDYISNKEAIASGVSKVTVVTNSGNLSKGGSLTSWKLIVASDSAFKTVVEEVAGTAMTKSKSETFEFKPATAVNWAENLFYKIEMNIVGGSANGVVWLNKVDFYGNVDESAPRITIANKAKDLLVGSTLTVETQIDNADGAVVTWTSSDEEVATIANGVVTGLKQGTTVIKAAITVGETEYEDSFELFVHTPHVEHSDVTLPVSGKTYKLGFTNASGLKFFNGEMSGFYASVSANSYEGIDVVVERSEKGWAIKYGTKYILPAVNGNFINFKYNDTLTVYATYMVNYKTFRWIVGGKDVFLGTLGTYGTGNGYLWSTVGDKTSYPMHLLEPKASAVTPDDKAVVKFFVEEHMHTEILPTEEGTGLCKTNKWYAFAKEDYTALTDAQKALFVGGDYTEPLARYNAWAVANGDSTIGVGTLSQVSTRANTVTNNNMMIIVIVSLATAISFAGLFVFLKKRKENR